MLEEIIQFAILSSTELTPVCTRRQEISGSNPPTPKLFTHFRKRKKEIIQFKQEQLLSKKFVMVHLKLLEDIQVTTSAWSVLHHNVYNTQYFLINSERRPFLLWPLFPTPLGCVHFIFGRIYDALSFPSNFNMHTYYIYNYLCVSALIKWNLMPKYLHSWKCSPFRLIYELYAKRTCWFFKNYLIFLCHVLRYYQSLNLLPTYMEWKKSFWVIQSKGAWASVIYLGIAFSSGLDKCFLALQISISRSWRHWLFNIASRRHLNNCNLDSIWDTVWQHSMTGQTIWKL